MRTQNADAKNVPFKNASRVQESILAPFEKRALRFLAGKLPAWMNSDHLTIAGFVAMMLAGLSYWLSANQPRYLLLAGFLLVVNWFGDSLDGTLARLRNRQRPRYGFYVDHIVDTFGALFLMGGLALSGYMHPWIAAGILICYYVLSIDIYLSTYTLNEFRLSYWIFGPTELRLLLIAGNIVLLFRPMVNVFGNEYRLFDAGGVCSIAVLSIVTIFSVIRNTKKLYHAERIA